MEEKAEKNVRGCKKECKEDEKESLGNDMALAAMKKMQPLWFPAQALQKTGLFSILPRTGALEGHTR